jgi:hypothetical protein
VVARIFIVWCVDTAQAVLCIPVYVADDASRRHDLRTCRWCCRKRAERKFVLIWVVSWQGVICWYRCFHIELFFAPHVRLYACHSQGTIFSKQCCNCVIHYVYFLSVCVTNTVLFPGT